MRKNSFGHRAFVKDPQRAWRRAAVVLICGVAFQSGTASPEPRPPAAAGTLREAAEARHIAIGAAAASVYLGEADYSGILGSEFAQLQAENEMKFGPIHPRPDSDPNPYDFSGADKLVAFAQRHTMIVRGHTLVWHNQVSDWVKKGNYSAPQLAAILQSHIAHRRNPLRFEGVRVGRGERSFQRRRQHASYDLVRPAGNRRGR